MKRILKVLPLVFVFLIATSCELDSGENFHFVTLRILDVELPENFELNQTYNIQVTYERLNGCVFFEGFQVQEPQLTTREVVAIGTELDDMDCTQAIEEGTASFNFNVLYEGTYTFRFFHDFDENEEPVYLEYEVEVLRNNTN